MKDLRREIEKIGRLVSFIIPRRCEGYEESALGRVYAEFENENYAKIAMILLTGKSYDGKEI